MANSSTTAAAGDMTPPMMPEPSGFTPPTLTPPELARHAPPTLTPLAPATEVETTTNTSGLTVPQPTVQYPLTPRSARRNNSVQLCQRESTRRSLKRFLAKKRSEKQDNTLVIQETHCAVEYEFDEYEYSRVQDFLDCYSDKLPQIIQVPLGYLGTTDLHTVAPDDFFVHGQKAQKRVVASGPNDIPISIPISTADKAMLKYKGKVVKEKLSSITSHATWKSKHSKPYQVTFSHGQAIVFSEDASVTVPPCELADLDVIDVYDEKYLVVSTITPHGGMYRVPLLIPTYVPLTVRRATGIVGMDTKAYADLLNSYQAAVDTEAVDKLETNNEIIILSNKDDDNDYEYVEPEKWSGVFTDSMIRRLELVKQKTYPTSPSPPVHPPVHPPRYPASTTAPSPTAKASERPLPILPPIHQTAVKAESDNMADYRNSGCTDPSIHSERCVITAQLAQSPVLEHRTNGNYLNTCCDTMLMSSSNDYTEASGVNRRVAISPAAPRPWVPPKPAVPEPHKQVVRFNKPYPLHAPDLLSGADPPQAGRHKKYQHGSDFDVLRRLPANREDMSVLEMAYLLDALGLKEHTAAFRDAKVDGALYMSTPAEIIQEEFKIGRFGFSKLEKFMRDGWVPKEE